VLTFVVMNETDLAALDRYALIGLVRKLVAEVESLRAEVETLKRSGKRQAAPFSKGTHVKAPKTPGRKPGQGMFKRREAPAPESLSEPPIGVPVAERACPKCGDGLVADRVEDASVVDLPAVVGPRVRLFRVGVRRCRGCGATVRGRHPDLAPDQRGATAHRLGPRLLAAAHQFHYGLGVPVRKLPEVLRLLTGVTLTQGAITRDALKKGGGAVGATYQDLCDPVAEAPYVHTDDTGWREGGRPAWLMVFETDAATVYQVRPRHRNEEVRERVPADYLGVMITDRGTSLRRRRAGRGEEAEVPGPRLAVAVGGLGDEGTRGAAVREAAEDPAEGGVGAVARASRGAGPGLRGPAATAEVGDNGPPARPNALGPRQPAALERTGPVPRLRVSDPNGTSRVVTPSAAIVFAPHVAGPS